MLNWIQNQLEGRREKGMEGRKEGGGGKEWNEAGVVGEV